MHRLAGNTEALPDRFNFGLRDELTATRLFEPLAYRRTRFIVERYNAGIFIGHRQNIPRDRCGKKPHNEVKP